MYKDRFKIKSFLLQKQSSIQQQEHTNDYRSY